MAWSKKKLVAKLEQYFGGKNIPFDYNGEEDRLSLELCFHNREYMLYPYISIEDSLLSIDINVVEYSQKGVHYETLNSFNEHSKFFKAFYTSSGVVCLEYRLFASEIDTEALDAIFHSLYALEDEIASL